MSGVECKKAMCVDRPLFFLRVLRRACLALLTHFALAFALLQKHEKKNKITPVMQATNSLKAEPQRRIWSKGGFSSTKIGRQKRVKEAMPG